MGIKYLFFESKMSNTNDMRMLILLFILTACAHNKPVSPKEELVSLDAALNHAQASYLKGCVDALKELKIPVAFPGCRDKANKHRQEIEAFIYQE